MTFAEKVMNARLALNLSQLELSEKIGVSERSIYSYEHNGALPRKKVLQKLAEVLKVSITYLTDEDETDKYKDMDEEFFYEEAKHKFGTKGAREAQAVLERASVLFAGGELDDEAKDVFFKSLMEVYMESKAEAREKFTPRLRASKKK
jgi:transcriptional regulator with XRE-family HTH domain